MLDIEDLEEVRTKVIESVAGSDDLDQIARRSGILPSALAMLGFACAMELEGVADPSQPRDNATTTIMGVVLGLAIADEIEARKAEDGTQEKSAIAALAAWEEADPDDTDELTAAGECLAETLRTIYN